MVSSESAMNNTNNNESSISPSTNLVRDIVLKIGSFKDRVFSVEQKDGIVRIKIHRDVLPNIAQMLATLKGVYLRTMMASDERDLEGVFKLYYVFGVDKEHTNIVLEVSLPQEDPSISTIVDINRAVDWYELEAHDMLGIEFLNRKLYRLVLPEDWPEKIYPLRKEHSISDLIKFYRPKAIEYAKEIGAENIVTIPIGPYHPALHEPEFFELYTRGEKVVDARYVGFMVHRGIEKLGEGMKYDQVPFLAERICGICGFVHSSSYCQAVENALNIDVPERALFIRSIILEIERIHSHLLWVGVALHLLGYDTGFMHSWRIREKVMILAELLTGSRKTYGINIVGGVRRDIDSDKISKALDVLKYVEKEFKQLVDISTSVPQVNARLKGTGILPLGEAIALSLVGPTARGSGLDRDVRRDYPYAAYRYVSFKVPTYSEGDNLARTLVRIDEVFESINMLYQLLDRVPLGSISVESWEAEPYKLGIGSVEAPRGEVIHVILTGSYSPYRWRVRAPTYQNLPAIPIMLRDAELADAPLTIASIDPCFSCTDRAIVINIDRGSIKTIPIEILSLKGFKAIG
jgi:Ni,Fe-hydrogenase III large subunit/Ni,Fe-hydrogenase III component G